MAEIGNYKGVMLCNRPAEFGGAPKSSDGPTPFASRVTNAEPLGWGPTHKLQSRKKKKTQNPDGVLARHKGFLKNLEQKKDDERADLKASEIEDKIKFEQIRENAAKQRVVVKKMKEEQDEMEFPGEEESSYMPPSKTTKGGKLTEDSLSQLGD